MSKTETLEEGLLETYEDLSPTSRRLTEFLAAHPEGTRPLLLPQKEDSKIPLPRHALQPWPLLAGPEKMREIRRAALGVADLVQSIPERIFEGDARRTAEYFGLEDPALAAPPPPSNAYGQSMMRGDFIDTDEGLRCIEMNVSPQLGGMGLGFWQSAVRNQPAVTEFLEREKIEIKCRDSLEELLFKIVDDVRKSSMTQDDGIGVALAVKSEGRALAEMYEPPMQKIYSRTLGRRHPGVEGQFYFPYGFDRFSVRSDRLYYDGRQIHGLINYSRLTLPDKIRSCFEAGNLILYNMPQSFFLGDKSAFALLSEHGESDLFNAEEKAILRDHMPWCRKVGSQKATYQGESWSLPDLLEKRRERFVLKEGRSWSGQDVFIGRYCTAEEWKRRVDDAVRGQSWIVQEFFTSRPYLFPSGEDDCRVHDVIWGFFCFGDHYGGGFLRTMLRGDAEKSKGMEAAGGVVNSKRGAVEGLMFEIAEGDDS